MKMDEHARAWAHEFVAGILNQSALPSEQRNSLHWEILSHLHEAAERRVEARGGTTITLADVQATAQDLGGPQKIAAAFLDTRVAASGRAGFGKRVGAYVLDAVVVWATLGMLWGFSGLFFPFGPIAPYPFFGDFLGMMGFALAYAYFVLMDARYGQTLGKMALKIKAVRMDGRPLEYREAMIRNVAKVIPPLLVIDVLFYLLAFKNEDQRASDRFAETIVIDTAKPAWQAPPAPAVPAPPPVARPADQFIPVDPAPPKDPETFR